MFAGKLIPFVLIPLMTVGIAHAQAAERTSGEVNRVGVYDSRAIAVAYAGTDLFRDRLKELRARQEVAIAAGDEEAAAAIEAEGAALQQKMHRQGFSTAPVDDILEQIGDKLPAIMEKHALAAIVSKWDEEKLAEFPGAERIDITMLLVDALGPDERQRKFAVEIQNRKPVPLDEIKEGGH
jgi:hypothetical protein